MKSLVYLARTRLCWLLGHGDYIPLIIDSKDGSSQQVETFCGYCHDLMEAKVD